jgi:O-acetyl-ADP-ribose deacetylase (regulator of RNase III)
VVLLQVKVLFGDWKVCAAGCDSVVNPANSNLSHAGGLAQLLDEAAGPEFKGICEAAIADTVAVRVGDAVVTGSAGLRADGLFHVIHAVAPR